MDPHLTTIGFFLAHGRHRTHDEQAQRAAHIIAMATPPVYDDLHDNDFGGDFKFLG